jgi:hypothetical protein
VDPTEGEGSRRIAREKGEKRLTVRWEPEVIGVEKGYEWCARVRDTDISGCGRPELTAG